MVDYIVKMLLLSPSFLKKEEGHLFPKEEYPMKPDFNKDFRLSDKIKFKRNGFGIDLELSPMIPQYFPVWMIDDLDAAKKRYVEQVVLPSYKLVSNELDAARDGFVNLEKFMIQTRDNDFFGLQDHLDFFRKYGQWKFFDYFHLGGNRSCVTDRLLTLNETPVAKAPAEMINGLIKYRELLPSIRKGENHGSNFFEGYSLKECVDKALQIYAFAEQLRGF